MPGSPRNSTTARRPAGTAAAISATPFAVGAGIDDASQATLAGSLGMQLVRLVVPWQSGETVPDPQIVSSLASLPAGTGLLLELSAAQLPSDDAGRAALAQYAASLARQVPSLRDLVLAPAPSVDTAAGYADTLAAVRTAVVGARPDVTVGPIFDGSTPQPQRTALNLAQELAHKGSRADVVSFLPAPVPGSGVWASSDLKRLEAALAKGSPVAPPFVLDAVPAPTNGDAASLGAQASAYAAAVQSASCAPNVSAVLFDRLVDGAAPAPATGIYDVNGEPKPSAAAVKGAIQVVARGAVVCPGRASRVTPTTLTFPGQLSPSTPASVVLGCDRDCLYLVALDRADGEPLVARRGSLNGGDPAKTITLPKRMLRPGSYRLDVRLVSRVGPSVITRQRGALLRVG